MLPFVNILQNIQSNFAGMIALETIATCLINILTHAIILRNSTVRVMTYQSANDLTLFLVCDQQSDFPADYGEDCGSRGKH